MWRGGLQSSELNLFTWNAITRAVAKGVLGGGGYWGGGGGIGGGGVVVNPQLFYN